MPNTTIYEFGDVVLVPFTFADLNNLTKKRPGVVISGKEYNAEGIVLTATRLDLILVMGLTSVQGDLETVAVKKWVEAGLKHPSFFKPAITTLPPDRVINKLGRLQLADINQLKRLLLKLLNLTPSATAPKQRA